MLGCGADGAVEVQFVRRPIAGPAAQAFERHLDVAGAQLDGVVEVFELALVPDLGGALVAGCVLPDAHAFGIVAIGAKGRGARSAHPFVATLMPAFLFLKPFLEGFHELIKAAQGFDLGAFFLREVLFRQLFEPVLRDIHRLQHLFDADLLQPFKGCGKGAVELVDVAFVFDHGGAGEIVKRLHVIGGQPRPHAFQKCKEFAQRDRDPVLAQTFKEGQEHPKRSAPGRSRSWQSVPPPQKPAHIRRHIGRYPNGCHRVCGRSLRR
mmetsp:Transcript_23429/g.41124  ORF Transcript_23429/g.41124 Transcript_23429/m.41124 type:complete len:265 (+) Transcript_23429:194-988(+)